MNTKPSCKCWTALFCLLLAIPASAADIFTFAGFTFDQRYSPTSGALLGNGAELGGAKFSTNLPNAATGTINFPQGEPGFDTAKSLAQLCGLGSGIRAVNLPRGNNDGSSVATNRHGIQVSWSNGRALANLPGIDFVVYESGSSSNGVEGIMARVRTNAVPEAWTDWYYFASTNFQNVGGQNVVFAFGFELSDMGVLENGIADRIQIANLTENDRIETTNAVDLGGIFVGQGKVIFDTNASDVLPDAGAFSVSRVYSKDFFDPDPLYIAALHNVCEGTAPLLSIEIIGNHLRVSWPAPSCYGLESSLELSGTNLLWTTPPESQTVTNGRHQVLVSNTEATRFFRLVK